jgi:type VI secretion system protein ImpH
MAAYGWRDRRSVARGLLEQGHRFSFLQAVHLLELMQARRRGPRDAKRPHEPEESSPDPVRFRTLPRADFPATDVEWIERAGRRGDPPNMVVNVLSLTGPMGPLPPHVSDLVMSRTARGNPEVAEFLDIFNHRLITLLYRARQKYRPALDVDAPANGRVARVLYALIGLGTRHVSGRMKLDDRALLPYAGLLADRRRSKVGLERMLSHLFDTEVEIGEFEGAWGYIDEDDITHIGETGQNQILGESAVLGRRVWDQAARFEVRMGPMTLEQFLSFLPSGKAHAALVHAIRFYMRRELEFTIRLILRKDEVPVLEMPNRLTPRRAQLGYTTWLRNRQVPVRRDDTQVRISRPEAPL